MLPQQEMALVFTYWEIILSELFAIKREQNQVYLIFDEQELNQQTCLLIRYFASMLLFSNSSLNTKALQWAFVF